MMREFGHNVDMRTHIAKVTSVSPFAIRIEGDEDDIEMDSLVVMQSILPHERKVKINGLASYNGAGASLGVASGTLSASGGTFDGVDFLLTFNEGYIEVGDEVWVLETNDGQLYHVIDKVVR